MMHPVHRLWFGAAQRTCSAHPAASSSCLSLSRSNCASSAVFSRRRPSAAASSAACFSARLLAHAASSAFSARQARSSLRSKEEAAITEKGEAAKAGPAPQPGRNEFKAVTCMQPFLQCQAAAAVPNEDHPNSNRMPQAAWMHATLCHAALSPNALAATDNLLSGAQRWMPEWHSPPTAWC